jgi:hypothetical protein
MKILVIRKSILSRASTNKKFRSDNHRLPFAHGMAILPCAMIKEAKQNIRYLGFETLPDGGRRFDFSITSPGQASTRVTLNIPALAFAGENRISYQESAKICLEKLRVILASESAASTLRPIPITYDDIARFRPIKRGQTRVKAATAE